jgi:predicted methyltransferase
MNKIFFDRFYNEFYPNLGKRKNSFEKIFKYLEQKNQNKYLIVETGTTRTDNLEGEGNSTILFDFYINSTKTGILYSIDNDLTACSYSRNVTSAKTNVVINDSVAFLANFPNIEEIDLLYLDSFDINPLIFHESQLHALKELTAVYAKLKPGCLIVIDDNIIQEDNMIHDIGKGRYIMDFFNHVNAEILFNGYQIGIIKE